MKKIFAGILAFALALVILPPLPGNGNSSGCTTTLTNVDGSIINCFVSSRSRFRVSASQFYSGNSRQRIRLNTGNNLVIAGQDVNGSSITSGNATFTQTFTSTINHFVVTFN